MLIMDFSKAFDKVLYKRPNYKSAGMVSEGITLGGYQTSFPLDLNLE